MKKWLALMGLTLGFMAAGARAQLPDFVDLIEKQSPAVVNITTTQDAPPFFRRFFPGPLTVGTSMLYLNKC